MSPFPWQAAVWRRLAEADRSDRLPHAMLFSGRAGVGKRRFAEAFAGYLLCNESAGIDACGACRSCVLYKAGNHPDFNCVEPDGESKAVLVDQIRELAAFTSLTSHFGKRKVALIAPAEAMNRAAANALLKTLEEPPANTVLLLVSNKPSLLPPTVRSRCQQYTLDRIDPSLALVWLADTFPGRENLDHALTWADNAPLQAAELDMSRVLQVTDAALQNLQAIADRKTEPVLAAEKLMEFAFDQTLQALRVIGELVIYQGAHVAARMSGDLPVAVARFLQARPGPINLQRAMLFHDQVLMCVRHVSMKSSLREIDLLEGLMDAWASVVHART